jgi:uncharacterized protein (TIGR02246 family)
MATSTLPAHDAADDASVRSIPTAMIAAWNRGDAVAFAAPFAEDATFIAFEGTELTGRSAIVDFHQALFATELKGTRLEGEARFVRFLGPDVAVMHARCGVVLAGRERTIPSRESMQLFVCRRRGQEWLVDVVMNARRLSLEQQLFADDFESLRPAEQLTIKSRVSELVAPARTNNAS